ncbi:MAG: PepSY domain-containing protein [Campylobacter sp.]|nr:PepSY domain-containing protein [Campylobacter sp.]
MKLFHRYIGIVFAYIGFFIFYSGTLGYFRDEINFFMQPNLYKFEYKNSDYINLGLNYLNQNHKNADIWEITPPNMPIPYIKVAYKDDEKVFTSRKRVVNLDPVNGEIIALKPTYGGNFIAKLHYNLWFMDIKIAREISCFLGFGLLFVFFSGFLARKNIFKNLNLKFTAINFHIGTGIFGFLVLFVVIITGIYLTERFVLSEIYEKAMSENRQVLQDDFYEKAKLKRQKGKKMTQISPQKYQITPSDMQNIKELCYGENFSKIIITKRENGVFLQINYPSKTLFSGTKMNFIAKAYDIKTKKLVDSKTTLNLATPKFVNLLFKNLHNGEIWSFGWKMVFVIFGIFSSLLCIYGILASRYKNSKIIKILNNTIFIGLNLAFGTYLLVNQLIFDSANLEIKAFFGSLIAIFILSCFIKNYLYALSSFAVWIVFLLVGILALKNGAMHSEISAILCICFLSIGLSFGYLGIKFKKERI